MRFFRLLLLLSALAFTPLAAAADAAHADRLVGVWREYSPSSNIVRFEKDGSTKLYLKKGEVGDLRTLDGKWTVSDTGLLSVIYVVGEKSMTLEAQLSYQGEEMILTEANGGQTRHRRHTGPIPEIYLW